MENLIILNSKEIKKILSLLEKQFGFNSKLDYVFLRNNENKIFLINRDIERIDLDRLRINNIGLYFGKIEHDMIRLSIEGSQLIADRCNKNIIILDNEQMKEYFKGENIKIDSELKGFVILKNKEDIIGCGKINNNLLLNFMPKERRIKKL